MISSSAVSNLNQDCLNFIFGFFELKQLCIVEQVSKLWEATAKNHSNWVCFAKNHSIVLGGQPFKAHIIPNRISFCTYVIKFLNFEETSIPFIQFKKEIGQKRPISSITVLEMCQHIEDIFPTETPQTLLEQTLTLENCSKVKDSDALITEIQFWLNLGAVVDERMCDAFFDNPIIFKLPEAAIFVINLHPDFLKNHVESSINCHLFSYILKFKKIENFNMQLVFPENLMIHFKNTNEIRYQTFVKRIPDFFHFATYGMLNEYDIYFSASEKELITKKLCEFAQPLIEQFSLPQKASGLFTGM